eukprot:Hpha_TRINITY_DN3893_c0_g1::TRINITY_DN3893_c0_g1_i1::g.44576::m.44576
MEDLTQLREITPDFEGDVGAWAEKLERVLLTVQHHRGRRDVVERIIRSGQDPTEEEWDELKVALLIEREWQALLQNIPAGAQGLLNQIVRHSTSPRPPPTSPPASADPASPPPVDPSSSPPVDPSSPPARAVTPPYLRTRSPVTSTSPNHACTSTSPNRACGLNSPGRAPPRRPPLPRAESLKEENTPPRKATLTPSSVPRRRNAAAAAVAAAVSGLDVNSILAEPASHLSAKSPPPRQKPPRQKSSKAVRLERQLLAVSQSLRGESGGWWLQD